MIFIGGWVFFVNLAAENVCGLSGCGICLGWGDILLSERIESSWIDKLSRVERPELLLLTFNLYDHENWDSKRD